ncbi:MAG TPA: M28 family metallopeptidase [Pyrinomonadaceae bacterium]|nr:M28 family metallopeptidase [Pyrinomonadaceae bacterium]
MFVTTPQKSLLARASAPLFAALLLLLPPTREPSAAQSGRAGASPKYAETPGNLTPFSGERAYEHVRKLVGFGPRPSGSKALERARRYIAEQLPGEREDTWTADTPAGKVRMTNIVCELPGQSEDTIVIAGHYDTKRFEGFDFVGANDGGSSAAALVELARAVAASREPRRFGYRFVFFDGEEAVCRDWDECGKPGAPDNTYGSRHYLAQLRARGELKHVRALVLLDMVGYERLELGRDTMSTPWLVDLIWETARGLGYGRQFVPRPESVGGDDHEPFLRAGIPSADLIQLSSYPHWHTAADTLDKISPASLKAVGDVVIKSLPRIEEKVSGVRSQVPGTVNR